MWRCAKGFQALADFAYTLISLLLYLPVVALWTLLLFVLVKVGWLALKALARMFFPGLSWWKRAEG